jgi:uncharacterized membrane protein YfcA
MLVGGIIVALVAAVAGASGFGFGLVATPFLLLDGFSLPFVVTVNLLTTLATRVPVAYRFGRHLWWRRALALIVASVPGLYLGARLISDGDATTIKLVAGALIVLAALALLVRRSEAPSAAPPGAVVAAGFLGGFLGTAASLNGVPPVLLLAHQRVETLRFFADLAVYAIGSAGLGIAALAATGGLSHRALFPAFVVWLPGAIAGNFLGTAAGLRLPQQRFRLLTLIVALVAGAITIATSA